MIGLLVNGGDGGKRGFQAGGWSGVARDEAGGNHPGDGPVGSDETDGGRDEPEGGPKDENEGGPLASDDPEDGPREENEGGPGSEVYNELTIVTFGATELAALLFASCITSSFADRILEPSCKTIVATIHMYSSQCIARDDLRLGQCLLLEFHEEFSELYGVKATMMNVHLLCHLTDCVLNWGPMWAYSCFRYENMNGTLKSVFHGSRDMSKQMAFCYIIMQALPSTRPVFESTSSTVATLADILYGRKRVVRQTVSSSVSVLGGVSYKVLLPDHVRTLSNFLQINGLDVTPGPLATVYRVNVDGEIYYSKAYTRVKKRNSYTVTYSTGCDSEASRRFATIEYFVCVQGRVVAILKPLNVLEIPVSRHFGLATSMCNYKPFIFPVRVVEDVLDVCFADDILVKYLLIDFTTQLYVATFPSAMSFD